MNRTNYEQESTPMLSIGIEQLDTEDDNVDVDSLVAFIYIDDKQIDALPIHPNNRLKIEIRPSDNLLQIYVRFKEDEENSYGSIVFPISEFKSPDYLGQDNQTWVTLFDDDDDNVYDGNFKDGDDEPPRMLFFYNYSYEIISQIQTGEMNQEEEEANISENENEYEEIQLPQQESQYKSPQQIQQSYTTDEGRSLHSHDSPKSPNSEETQKRSQLEEHKQIQYSKATEDGSQDMMDLDDSLEAGREEYKEQKSPQSDKLQDKEKKDDSKPIDSEKVQKKQEHQLQKDFEKRKPEQDTTTKDKQSKKEETEEKTIETKTSIKKEPELKKILKDLNIDNAQIERLEDHSDVTYTITQMTRSQTEKVIQKNQQPERQISEREMRNSNSQSQHNFMIKSFEIQPDQASSFLDDSSTNIANKSEIIEPKKETTKRKIPPIQKKPSGKVLTSGVHRKQSPAPLRGNKIESKDTQKNKQKEQIKRKQSPPPATKKVKTNFPPPKPKTQIPPKQAEKPAHTETKPEIPHSKPIPQRKPSAKSTQEELQVDKGKDIELAILQEKLNLAEEKYKTELENNEKLKKKVELKENENVGLLGKLENNSKMLMKEQEKHLNYVEEASNKEKYLKEQLEELEIFARQVECEKEQLEEFNELEKSVKDNEEKLEIENLRAINTALTASLKAKEEELEEEGSSKQKAGTILSDLNSKYENIINSTSTMQEDFETLKTNLETELQSLSTSLSQSLNKNAELNTELSQTQHVLSQSSLQIKSIEDQLSSANESLLSSTQSSNAYKASSQSSLNSLNLQNLALSNANSQQAAQIQILKDANALLEAKLAALAQQDSAQKLQSALDAKQKLRNEKEELLLQFSELEEKYKILYERWNHPHIQSVLKERERATQQMADLHSQLKELQDSCSTENVQNDKEFQQVVNQYQLLQNDMETMKEYLQQRVLECKEKETEIQELKEELTKQKELLSESHIQTKILEENFNTLKIEIKINDDTLALREHQITEKDDFLEKANQEIILLSEDVEKKDRIIMQNEVEAKRKMESFETFEERIQKSEYLLDEMRKNTKEKEKKLESSSLQVKKNKKYITELEHRLVENNEQIESLSRKLKLQNDENIELETLLRKKNIEIQELRRRIQELEDELEEKTKEFFYEPDPKDKLDEMFAHYINKNRCPVSITKIGEGQYIFGTRKIFAKIQNERLVVRVGGGFMMIDEFLSAYTAQEIAKLKREEKHSYNVTSSQSSNLNTGNVTPKDRSYRAPFQNSYSKNANLEGEQYVYEEEAEEYDGREGERSSRQSPLIKRNSNKAISHEPLYKSTSKDRLERKASSKLDKRSRSPIGSINGTNRMRIINDREMENIKSVSRGRGAVTQPKDNKFTAKRGNISYQSDIRYVNEDQ